MCFTGRCAPQPRTVIAFPAEQSLPLQLGGDLFDVREAAPERVRGVLERCRGMGRQVLEELAPGVAHPEAAAAQDDASGHE